MNMTQKKVLVLGNDNSSFLTVIRSLGRKGIVVEIGMCDSWLAATKSRYVSKMHEIQLVENAKDFDIESFCNLIDKEEFSLIIPCNDPSIITIQMHRSRLQQNGNVYLLNDEIYDITSNKFKINNIATELGIKIPKEKLITTYENNEHVIDDFGLPVVLKPLSSFYHTNIKDRRNVYKAYSKKYFELILSKMLNDGNVIVQKNFIGTGFGVECLVKDGIILTAFQHERVHEPLHGGGSSYRKSVPIDSQLLNVAELLLGHLKYTGVAMLEFKKNLKSDDWVFVEINARFWGSLPLAVASGIDFPYYLYEMLVYGKNEFNRVYKTGLYCRNLAPDIEWMRYNLKADKKDQTLCTKPLYSCLSEFVNLITLKEYNDTITINDPIPGIIQIKQIVKSINQRILVKVYLKISKFILFRVIIRKVIASKVRNAKKIIFICKGNICRSPFAQLYAAKILPKKLKFLSAGYIPLKGRLSPGEALAAATKFGIDLSHHSSRKVTSDDLYSSDVIFVFDKQNYTDILINNPSVLHKVYLLGVYNNTESSEISDPNGQSEKVFYQIYYTIKTCIDMIKEHF